jgi:hypothetical protein
MTSIAFCSVCGKSEIEISEFTNKDGSTICKECWLADNNKDDKK